MNTGVETAVELMTAEALFDLPDSGMRSELVKGELRTMPPAGFEHGAVAVNVTVPLSVHVNENKLGVVVAAETGYVIERDPDTVRAPDVSFVSKDRIEQIGVTKKFFPEAPDLVVEVLSPGDTVFEVEDKVEDWLRAGVKLVWVVNPKRRTVKVYRTIDDYKTLTEKDELDGEEVVPGFRLALAEIFT